MKAIPVCNLLRQSKTLFSLFVAISCVMTYFPYKMLRNYHESLSVQTHDVAGELSMSKPINVIVEKLYNESTNDQLVIAIGSGITSRKLQNVSAENVEVKFQFFQAFLPTFCNTASPHFIYKVYLAFDNNDVVFANQLLRDAFKRHFYIMTTTGSCGDRRITAELSLVECSYTGKPAWAQNDAMLEAYLDHVDYLYRINDDTKLLTRGWTEKFISKLESYNPPRVGVVGPYVIGSQQIFLTYEFVHRTHIDIFGFYYPHVFTDWYADTWLSFVYESLKKCTSLIDVRLIHTKMLGRRYDGHVKTKILLDRHNLAENTALINR